MTRYISLAVMAVMLLTLPQWLPAAGGYSALGSMVLIHAIAPMGLHLLLAIAGGLPFGQAAAFGIGGACAGLPRPTACGTPHLGLAMLARHDPNALDFVQDDGAVVEQFRVINLDQMIAFDCGAFELK